MCNAIQGMGKAEERAMPQKSRVCTQPVSRCLSTDIALLYAESTRVERHAGVSVDTDGNGTILAVFLDEQDARGYAEEERSSQDRTKTSGRNLGISPVRNGFPVIVCRDCGTTIFDCENGDDFTTEELLGTTCRCGPEQSTVNGTVNALDAAKPPKTEIPFGRIAEAIEECTNDRPGTHGKRGGRAT